MIKQKTYNVVKKVIKNLDKLNKHLEEKHFLNKDNLMHELLNIKEYYDTNVEHVKLTDNPDFLALKTCLGDVDDIFSQLKNEIEKT